MALFGPNGAGKTNLIEAVSLLSPGRGLRGAASEEMARAPGADRLEGHGRARRAGGGTRSPPGREGAGRPVEIDGKAATQTALGAVARVLWLTPAMDRLWLEGAGERRRFLDRVALASSPSTARWRSATTAGLRERNRLIRDEVRDAGWFAALEAQMAELGAQLVGATARAALARLAAAPAGAFPRAELALEGEGPRDAAGLAAALARGPRARPGGGADAGRAAPRRPRRRSMRRRACAARLCSTGEQKALLISLVLANAWAVARGLRGGAGAAARRGGGASGRGAARGAL